jgi:polysaccharide pyruvyl transferase WcaK-like protein
LLKVPSRTLDIVRTLYQVRKFDIVVVPGTGILDDFGEPWYAMPYDLFKWSLAAMLGGRPFTFVSVGAGPIQHPLSTWLMVAAARMAQYCSFRDNVSWSYMSAQGIRASRKLIFPDLAFSLVVPGYVRKTARGHRIEPPTIGLGIMNYHGWKPTDAVGPEIHEKYQSKMASFAGWLLTKGYRLRFLMGAGSDRDAIDDILRRLAGDGRSVAGMQVFDEAASLDELMRQIVETDVVVATRFHNLVAALMAGKPVLSIGYAAKNAALLAEAGLDAFHQEIDQLDVGLLIRQFEDLMQRREELSGRAMKAVEHFRGLLHDQETYLLSTFL